MKFKSTDSFWRKWGKLGFTISVILALSYLLMTVLFTEKHIPIRPPAKELQNYATKNDQQAGHNIILHQSPYPIPFRLGHLDERFGISRNKFLDLVNEAKSLWEVACGKNLFIYDSSALFRINLRFDERQQRRIEERKLRNQIDATGLSFNKLNREYESELGIKNRLERNYDIEVLEFNRRAVAHTSKVEYWNNQGGAPASIYGALSEEQTELEREGRNLGIEKVRLEDIITDVNELAEKINKRVAAHNLQIAFYNGQFVDAREFEAGVYDGQEINIYEFDNDRDLKLTIVHELGHAIGFGHVDDSTAIMYPKLEKQNMRNIRLGEADLKLLHNKFPQVVTAVQ